MWFRPELRRSSKRYHSMTQSGWCSQAGDTPEQTRVFSSCQQTCWCKNSASNFKQACSPGFFDCKHQLTKSDFSTDINNHTETQVSSWDLLSSPHQFFMRDPFPRSFSGGELWSFVSDYTGRRDVCVWVRLKRGFLRFADSWKQTEQTCLSAPRTEDAAQLETRSSCQLHNLQLHCFSLKHGSVLISKASLQTFKWTDLSFLKQMMPLKDANKS